MEDSLLDYSEAYLASESTHSVLRVAKVLVVSSKTPSICLISLVSSSYLA
jgi:hypothetical protein